MFLSEYERAVLANQYRILAALADHDFAKADYEQRASVFERGYEYDYASAMTTDGAPMAEGVADEVHRILTMFRVITPSIEKATNLSDETKRALEFVGFDGNSESEQYSYVKFYIETGRYEELRRVRLNSHFQVLGRYRRMLKVYESIPRDRPRFELTPEELEMIASAQKVG